MRRERAHASHILLSVFKAKQQLKVPILSPEGLWVFSPLIRANPVHTKKTRYNNECRSWVSFLQNLAKLSSKLWWYIHASTRPICSIFMDNYCKEILFQILSGWNYRLNCGIIQKWENVPAWSFLQCRPSCCPVGVGQMFRFPPQHSAAAPVSVSPKIRAAPRIKFPTPDIQVVGLSQADRRNKPVKEIKFKLIFEG